MIEERSNSPGAIEVGTLEDFVVEAKEVKVASLDDFFTSSSSSAASGGAVAQPARGGGEEESGSSVGIPATEVYVCDSTSDNTKEGTILDSVKDS